MAFFIKPVISLRARFKSASAPSEAAQFGRDPRADWRIVCLSFLILTLLAVSVNLFIYEKISNGEIFRSTETRPAPLRALNRFELEQTVLFYENKHERFDELRRAPLEASDPFVPEAKPRE